MSIVRFMEVVKSYGPKCVLDHVTLDLQHGEKAGLVGANGAGKTTLFKLITGELTPDEGSVVTSRGLKVGYLPQIPTLSATSTVLDEAGSVFGSVWELERRLVKLAHDMTEHHDSDELAGIMAQYDRLRAQFEAAGGYTIETRIGEVLGGLGFGKSEQELPVAVLSGGQKCRVALAKLLLSECDLLLLDEPTNHLDIQATQFLEEFLADFDGGVVVVSHDRYLLDRVVSKIIELERRRVSVYPTNYTHYHEAKHLRALTQEREYAKQQEFIAKEKDFIARHLAGQRSQEAKGRRTRLERLMNEGGLIERPAALRQKIGVEFDGTAGPGAKSAGAKAAGAKAAGAKAAGAKAAGARIPSRTPTSAGAESAGTRIPSRTPASAGARIPSRTPASAGARIPSRTPTGEVLRCEGLAKRYGDLTLFDGLRIQIQRGEKLGIIGPNGCGKTTLLRMMMGVEQPDAGTLAFAERAVAGYYDQEHRGLDRDNTVIDEVRSVRPGTDDLQVRSFLATFLFTGDDVFKRVGDLSGGEQSRVVLAKLMWSSPQTLVLDEPTNHLDIPGKEALEEALNDFPGTIIMVSHDRYFLDSTVTGLLVLERGRYERFAGNYSEWQHHRAAQEFVDALERGESAGAGTAGAKSAGARIPSRTHSSKARLPAGARIPSRTPSAPHHAPPRAAAKYDRMSIEDIEQLIIEREEQLAAMEARFGEESTYRDPQRREALQTDYDTLKAELAELNLAWEERG